MSGDTTVGARILAAQARHCAQLSTALAAARAAGAPAAEIEDLEAQNLAARKRYQELAVDMPTGRSRLGAGRSGSGRRPWWRFW
jgi:hypothetical protein